MTNPRQTASLLQDNQPPVPLEGYGYKAAQPTVIRTSSFDGTGSIPGLPYPPRCTFQLPRGVSLAVGDLAVLQDARGKFRVRVTSLENWGQTVWAIVQENVE